MVPAAQQVASGSPSERIMSAQLPVSVRPDDGLPSDTRFLLVNGTLPGAILVGLGLGLAVLGLSLASIWQWFAR
jgi:hypothetical protein